MERDIIIKIGTEFTSVRHVVTFYVNYLLIVEEPAPAKYCILHV